MKARVAILFTVITVVANASVTPPSCAFNSQDEISFGLQTVIWSYMWDDGRDLSENVLMSKRRKELWAFVEYNLEKIKAIGGQWNIVTLDQKKWSGYTSAQRARKLAKIVEKHRNIGLSCVLRVKLDPMVYRSADCTDGKGKKCDALVFHRRFLSEISNYYDEGAKAILIGNEVDGQTRNGDNGQAIGYSEYKKILDQSYIIIKSGDSRILVGDHGAASHSLCHAYILDLLKEGRTDAAYAFWKNFMAVPGKERNFSMSRFRRSIARKGIKARAQFVLDSLENPGSADFFQLHHYRSWETVSPLLTWVRKKLNAANSSRPIYACEIGYLMPLKRRLLSRKNVAQDMDRFSERDQALELIKTIVTFLGNDVNNVLYWQIRWNADRGWAGRLFKSTDNPNEFKPLLAANSFELLARILNGRKALHEKVFKNEKLLEYSFVGKNKITVIWSQGGEITVPLNPVHGKLKSAINLLDQKSIQLAPSSLRVDATPVMITWE